MEEKEVKVKQPQRKNSFLVVGFLRENNLEVVTDKKGQKVIRGKVTIAISATNSHTMQFYVTENKKDGSKNDTYTKMLSLLPSNTLSIATYLSSNPSATYETAANAASKVWCHGRMEEYVYFDEENKERTMTTLKGDRLGFKTAQDQTPFSPQALFDCEIYIEKIVPEYKDEAETGRYLLTGLYPHYSGRMMRFGFVAPTEDGIADYIVSNYHPTDTVTVTCDMTNMAIKEKPSDAPVASSFGRALSLGNQIKTTFIKENIIRGGSQTPIAQGEPGCITTANVKDGLAQRLVAAQEASEKRKEGNNGGQKKTPTSAQTAQAGFGRPSMNSSAPQAATSNFEFDNDIDFGSGNSFDF